MRRWMIGLGLVLAATFSAGAPARADTADPKAVKIYIMIDVPDLTNLGALDRWYMTYHSQQMHRAMRAWQKNYLSYRSYIVPDDVARRYHVWRGRMTEIYYDSLGDFAEGRKNNPLVDMLDPPPGGWADRSFARSQPVIVPVNPQQVYLQGRVPPKETPYFRWVIYFRYPAGVSEAEGDKWLLGTHVPEMAKVPGLRRYFGYRTLEDPADPATAAEKLAPDNRPRYGRVEELWFDDYKAWCKAFVDTPPAFTKPGWGGEFPYVDYISTFIGENPDVDFLNDKRVIP
ncbi:hypothetical protein ACVENA_12120 [Sphingopyxis sp. 550A]